jgi:hypothetical protein
MKQDPIRYYQEPNGDYLAVEPGTGHYNALAQRFLYNGRATSLEGQHTSVCSTSVARVFLQGCTRVRKDAVPPSGWRPSATTGRASNGGGYRHDPRSD